MNLQAINGMQNCQPIRPASFSAKRKNPLIKTSQRNTFNQKDQYICQSKDGLEEKYDLACRLAAYYKQLYEGLLADKKINATVKA